MKAIVKLRKVQSYYDFVYTEIETFEVEETEEWRLMDKIRSEIRNKRHLGGVEIEFLKNA